MESNEWVAKQLFAGGLANALGIIIGNPLDVVKVRLQSMPDAYKSAVHCFQSIIKFEGIGGLFKGVWSPTWAQFVMGSLSFAGNEIALSILEPGLKRGESPSVRNGFVSGCAGGLAQTIVLVPTDLVKCKMQMSHVGGSVGADGSLRPSYSNSWDCVRQTIRAEGVSGLFRGFGVTCLREVPSFGVYFLTYSKLVDALTPTNAEPSVSAILLAGGAAGSLSWSCIYPVDVIKTNLQIYASSNAVGTNSEKIPTTILGMGRHLMKKHGIKVFATGLGTTVVRAFPVNAAVFMFYEQFKSAFGL